MCVGVRGVLERGLSGGEGHSSDRSETTEEEEEEEEEGYICPQNSCSEVDMHISSSVGGLGLT